MTVEFVVVLGDESLNIDGQQFHHYQQSMVW